MFYTLPFGGDYVDFVFACIYNCLRLGAFVLSAVGRFLLLGCLYLFVCLSVSPSF